MCVLSLVWCIIFEALRKMEWSCRNAVSLPPYLDVLFRRNFSAFQYLRLSPSFSQCVLTTKIINFLVYSPKSCFVPALNLHTRSGILFLLLVLKWWTFLSYFTSVTSHCGDWWLLKRGCNSSCMYFIVIKSSLETYFNKGWIFKMKNFI